MAAVPLFHRLSAQQRAILRELGIDVWQLRAQPDVPPIEVPAPLPAEEKPVASGESWELLHDAIRSCTLCSLHETRTQAVCGVGHPHADWLIIGEAPGADEDRQGEPFVGRAGQLLNEMLRAIGLQREHVFITNILKCRPPNNRDPRLNEINECLPYLQRQIALLQPKLILVVGRVAAQALLQVDKPLGALRGKVHEYAGVPLVVTYHPAYLLRTPAEKSKSWQDLLLALDVMAASG